MQCALRGTQSPTHRHAYYDTQCAARFRAAFLRDPSWKWHGHMIKTSWKDRHQFENSTTQAATSPLPHHLHHHALARLPAAHASRFVFTARAEIGAAALAPVGFAGDA